MEGRYYGYNRVSTKDQHLDRGRKTITDFCTQHNYPLSSIFEDKQSGRSFERIRYTVLKEDVLRPGDTLIVPEYDRLGRADETKQELEYFKLNNIRVVFLDIPTTQMDISAIPDEMARMILLCINDMLISFYDLMARTELKKKKKRQREGIDSKKERGEWDDYGRPRVMNKEEFAKRYQRVVNNMITASEFRKEQGLSTSTFYRYVEEYKKGISLDDD